MKKCIRTELNAQLIYQDLKHQCQEQSHQVKAVSMKAYMKHLFDFYGINAHQRKELVRTLKKRCKFAPDNNLWQLVEYLWADPHIEMRYSAIALLTPICQKNVWCRSTST